MRLLTPIISGNMLDTASFFMNKTLVWRMMLTGIPLICCCLFVVLYLTCNEIKGIVTSAIARNEQMHAEAIAKNLEDKLLENRNQLMVLAAGGITRTEMLRRLNLRNASNHLEFREIAFMSTIDNDRYILLNTDHGIIELQPHTYFNAPYSPFLTSQSEAKRGTVRVSPPLEVHYNMIKIDQQVQDITLQVIRLSITIFDDQENPIGILTVSVDLKVLRNILSKESFVTPSLNDENAVSRVRSMFFDSYGWILFQSENPNEGDLTNLPLRYDDVRRNLQGDIGRPGFKQAFRPATEYTTYQDMIEDIRNSRSGHRNLPTGDTGWSKGQTRAECVSYAPIRFQCCNEKEPEVIGGIGILDTTFTASETYNNILQLFVIGFLVAVFLLSLSLWWIGRFANRSIKALTLNLQERNAKLATEPIDLPQLPLEVENLRLAINEVLLRLHRAKAQHATHLAASTVRKLTAPVENLPKPQDLEQELLIGVSPQIVQLRKQIKTIANVQGDVLIVGETGTGKELVSQAIHAASNRKNKPFISINCGALDENLLMDTLFGHVKGAFTEAKQDRKGAFIAAGGGTLMLDEIGNATPKVQQALLRALSTRKVRPLGSDQELDFDARIVAATNADLRNDGKDGGFRNDLYFRLSVFSIQTTPLRECKEDILPLCVHFMSQLISSNSQDTTTQIPDVSHGALEKLMQYNWPGNVRELKNVITRALAFCKNNILQSNDILLDVQEEQSQEEITDVNAIDSIITHVSPNLQDVFAKLNARQQTVLPIILENGSITRQEYQDLSNDNISTRTAQYDLQELASLGIIRKEGRGASQRYVIDCAIYNIDHMIKPGEAEAVNQ
ncbi:MAG: sigma 54-interacting transcriptional regulator [Desulfovibrionaceae bacterium]|nr:sigma 54-interacting transcriptional regulator [Desulfovibrionaceae bacterium]